MSTSRTVLFAGMLTTCAAMGFPVATAAQPRASRDYYFAAGTVYTLGSGGAGDRTGAWLAWTCAGSQLRVIYTWDKYLGGRGGRITVTRTVDGGGPTAGEWTIRDDHVSAVMPSNQVAGFTSLAKAGLNATLSVQDIDGETLSDAFSLLGVTLSLPRLGCAN